MLGMCHSAAANREVEQVNWFSLQNVMGLTFTLRCLWWDRVDKGLDAFQDHMKKNTVIILQCKT